MYPIYLTVIVDLAFYIHIIHVVVHIGFTSRTDASHEIGTYDSIQVRKVDTRTIYRYRMVSFFMSIDLLTCEILQTRCKNDFGK